MKKRERKYFIHKRLLKLSVKSLAVKIWNNLFDWHVAGTNVFINDKGNVEVQVLTHEECMYWLSQPNIPENISITTDY